MNKEELRRKALTDRKSLSNEAFSQRNHDTIKQALKLIKNGSFRHVHLFLPISKNKEVDTWPIYEYLIASEAHTPIVSKTHFKQNLLTHHPMKTGEILKESNYGIPEPIHTRSISPDQIDLILVPLLVFDTKGQRIGYGAGFYDRFLAQCSPEALKVGLAISEPSEDLIHTNEFDVPLDLCINHKQVFDFR